MRKLAFPFDNSENTDQVKKLISSLLNLIFKLSNSSDYRIEDTSRFTKKLEHSIDILKSLYRISEVKIIFKSNLFKIKFVSFLILFRMRSNIKLQ